MDRLPTEDVRVNNTNQNISDDNDWNMEGLMGQAMNVTSALFPLANIFRRMSGLAHFPELKKSDEPFLDEVMADPIIVQMMAADNLDAQDVRQAITRAQTRLHHR